MNENPPFIPNFSKPTSYPGLDWNFISSCDPVMIHETKDFNSLQLFTSSFINSKLTQSDKAVLSHPLSFKLIQLLQITIQYMYDCQQELSSTIDELNESNKIYKQKIQLLVKEQNRTAVLLRDAYHDFEKCPVCGKKFKTIKHVDQHMKKNHSEHLLAWKSLRINNPIDPNRRVKELQDEITFLRDHINKQNSQFMKTVQNFNAQLEAQKRDFERKRKVVPTMEHIESNRQYNKEDLDMKILDPYKFEKEDGVTYPRIMTEQDQFTKFNQKVVHLENHDLNTNDSENYQNIEDAEGWLVNKTQNASSRIHLGLGANYITPKQVEGILRYDNPTYQHFYDAAKTQLERDFPMPDKRTLKRAKIQNKDFFEFVSSSSGSFKKADSSLALTPSPAQSSPASVSSYNTNSSIENSRKHEKSPSVGEIKTELKSESYGTSTGSF